MAPTLTIITGGNLVRPIAAHYRCRKRQDASGGQAQRKSRPATSLMPEIVPYKKDQSTLSATKALQRPVSLESLIVSLVEKQDEQTIGVQKGYCERQARQTMLLAAKEKKDRDQDRKQLRVLRVLTIDGDGTRGLSSLYLLKSLMEYVNTEKGRKEKAALKPHELFHLIGGNSAGGLIAIMLGRLKMDVEECIQAYVNLPKEVFEDPRSAMSETPYIVKNSTGPKLRSEDLRTHILGVIQKQLQVGNPESELLHDSTVADRCHVFVCATSEGKIKRAQRLRSYGQTESNRDSIFVTKFSIADAAIATLTSTTSFDHGPIGHNTFVDGANNLGIAAIQELQNIYRLTSGDIKSKIGCFVSLGTRDPRESTMFDRIWRSVTGTVKSSVTAPRNEAKDFERRHQQLVTGGRAFRFDVNTRLHHAQLDERKWDVEIEQATKRYLKTRAHYNRFVRCAKRLSERAGFSSRIRYRIKRWLSNHCMLSLIFGSIVAAVVVRIYAYRFEQESHADMTHFQRQMNQVNLAYPIFAVLGVTGVGKSSFIRDIGGEHVLTGRPPTIGHTLQSETQESQVYKFRGSGDPFKFGYLIDTPGIEESNRTRSNQDILHQIRSELNQPAFRDKSLRGIIFLWDIHFNKAYAFMLDALEDTISLMESVLGSGGGSKLTLITNKWPRNPTPDEAQAHRLTEESLRKEYWQGLLDCGAKMERYDQRGRNQALQLLSEIYWRARPSEFDPPCTLSGPPKAGHTSDGTKNQSKFPAWSVPRSLWDNVWETATLRFANIKWLGLILLVLFLITLCVV